MKKENLSVIEKKKRKERENVHIEKKKEEKIENIKKSAPILDLLQF